jgi:ABC-type sulfate/molybdate transport systems ATPase subunit
MLKVEKVSFAYRQDNILKDINFSLKRGDHLAVIGESGCGKSTLLKLIYGLLPIDKGAISWNRNPVLGPNFNLVPGEPKMKFLSQDFDLMPFTTVAENISQFLSVFYPEALQSRTRELLEMIEMTSFAKTKVKHLSGGQQQRVALARVLAQEPELLLLDEPFSHIDNFSKNSLRRNLFAHLKKKKISCLVATHDMEDVLPFADEILVLKDRTILALDSPANLYQNPKSNYVAGLFGEVNLLPIRLLKPYSVIDKSILIYPSEFQVSDKSGLKVAVKKSYFKGTHYLNEGIADGAEPIFFDSKKELIPNQVVYLNVALETITLRLADKKLIPEF